MSTPKEQTSPHVAVLFYRLGPYHHARLKAAAARLRVTAVEFSNMDPTYAWDAVEGDESFDHLTLFSGEQVSALPARRIFAQVCAVLDQLRPQVVAIPGWSDRCSLAALRWCRARGVPAIVMSETTAWDDARKWWKEALKRRVVGLGSAALVGGRAHADYLEQLGIGRERIFFGYDAVDNEYFREKAEMLKAEIEKAETLKAEVRVKLPGSHAAGSIGNSPVVPSPPTPSPQVSGLRSQPSTLPLPTSPFFLASARFVEKKNLPRLLQAYVRYRELAEKAETLKPETLKSDNSIPSTLNSQLSTKPWDLVLLGDGPLRASLTSQVSRLKLQDCVKMPGFKQYDELPAYYGLASAFIHASSTEQWGLVVNEAMASGLPVLVSNRCGCAKDLVQEGRNGFTFDPCNVEELAGLMLKISALNFPLSEFGLMSREIISQWGPARFADGLSKAVQVALSDPSPKAKISDRLLLRLLLMRGC